MAQPAGSERLNMLQRNNQQLSAELARVREENSRLESGLAEMRAKQCEYGDTLAAVDRTWQQLNQDMAYLARRLRGFPADAKQEDGMDTDGTDAVMQPAPEGLPGADPLLRRLIGGEHAGARGVQKRLGELADDATEVEKALAPRAAATFEAFAALLELHEQRLAAGAAQPSGQPEAARLQAEAVGLRREADAQRGVARTAQAQLAQLTDMLRKDEVTMQELSNELADKREEVAAANRKLHALRSGEGSGGAAAQLASQASLPPPAAREPPSPAPLLQPDADDALRIAQHEARAAQERADALARQLREAHARMQDESFVAGTALGQALRQQAGAAAAELGNARRLLEAAQREADACKHAVQGLAQQAEEAGHQRRMAHLSQERIQGLEQQLAAARAAQEAAELALQAERQKYGSAQTQGELLAMVGVLRQEAQAAHARAGRHRELLEEADVARSQARAGVAAAEAREAELKLMAARAARWEADKRALQEREKELKAAADDLRVFVEVLQGFCEDPREVAEVRASEAALKAQLAGLQTQLAGHELQVALEQSKAAAAEAHEAGERAERERAALRVEADDLRRQNGDLQQRVQLLTADLDTFTGEMEVVGNAFDELSTKESVLLQKLAQADDRGSALLAERIQAQHAAAAAAEQRASADAARRLAEQQAGALHERVAALEARLQETLAELGQARERATAAAQQAERLAGDVRERDAATAQLQAQVAALAAAADARQRALDEEAEKLQRERAKRQHLEEEHKALQSKVERLVADPGRAAHEELEGMRLLTRCRVCHARPKDTVITKCWHTFCGECIRRNLEARNRKCPACGHQFGAHDVKQIYL